MPWLLMPFSQSRFDKVKEKDRMCVYFSYHRQRGRELYKKVVLHGQSDFKLREMGPVHMGYFTLALRTSEQYLT